jgi:pimeloyl-ACP methyl ester carboxylesterase
VVVTIEERWVSAAGVRLHYRDTGSGPVCGLPAVVLPGFGEWAQEYDWLLAALHPRRALAVDLRGRGGSDAPEVGYSWECHIGDVEAVVEAAELEKFALVTISRGTSYGLGYALTHPGRVRGLLVGDYFARHAALPDDWPDRALATTVLRGMPLSERMPAHAVRQIQREAVDVPLWDRLPELGCPVCVVRGTRRSVLVTDELAMRYRDHLPGVQIEVLEGAGHDLWSENPQRFAGVARSFLADVDGGLQG